MAAQIEANNLRIAKLIGMKFQAEELMRAEQELRDWQNAVEIRDRLRQEGVI